MAFSRDRGCWSGRKSQPAWDLLQNSLATHTAITCLGSRVSLVLVSRHTQEALSARQGHTVCLAFKWPWTNKQGCPGDKRRAPACGVAVWIAECNKVSVADEVMPYPKS